MIWLNDDLFYVMKSLREEEVRRHLEARRAARTPEAAVSPSLSRRDARTKEPSAKAGLCPPGCCARGAA